MMKIPEGDYIAGRYSRRKRDLMNKIVYEFSFDHLRTRMLLSGLAYRDLPVEYRLQLRMADHERGEAVEQWGQHTVVYLPLSNIRVPLKDCIPVHIFDDETCDGDCDYCQYRRVVPGTDERIDREPSYYCEWSVR